MEARCEDEDLRIKLLKENIQFYPDFPKQGVIFQDIFGAMRKAPVLKVLMELIQEYARKFQGKVDCVVGLDSRGFLFGPIMALELEVPFIPVSFRSGLCQMSPDRFFTSQQTYFPICCLEQRR